MSGMNSHIHVVMETETLEKIRDLVNKEVISIYEFCRTKLKESSQLDRIEGKLDGVLKKI